MTYTIVTMTPIILMESMVIMIPNGNESVDFRADCHDDR